MELRKCGLVARGKSNKNSGAGLSLDRQKIEQCAALCGTNDVGQFAG